MLHVVHIKIQIYIKNSPFQPFPGILFFAGIAPIHEHFCYLIKAIKWDRNVQYTAITI